MDALTVITGVFAVSFGVSTVLTARENEKLKIKQLGHEDELERGARANQYLTNDLQRLNLYIADCERNERYYRDKFNEVLARNGELIKKLKSEQHRVIKFTAERNHYKSLLSKQENIIQLPLTQFKTIPLTPFVHQFTARGNDLFRPDAEIENKIRKDISESIASTLKITLIESQDAQGMRKDSQIKFILKQLDYEL